jgi:hypothetical protein
MSKGDNYLQGKLSLDVIMDCGQLIRDLNMIFALDSHVLREWNAPLLLDELSRLKPVVEGFLHLIKSSVDHLSFVDSFLSEILVLTSILGSDSLITII